MRKFWRDIHGAVTVFVTILLIPAILVTGTAVDISAIYAGQAMVRNANEMAMNSLLSDYDSLLNDLYGLFAVTADNAEITNTLNTYLSLTLFHDDSKTEGRILFNDVNFDTAFNPAVSSLSPNARANLQNKEILRRQIEEYVKLRAPAFLIEQVLDKIEHFTKFIPDLTAVWKKLLLDDSMQLLDELNQLLYYRMRYHESYINDKQLRPEYVERLQEYNLPEKIVLEDAKGFEMNMAAELDEELSRLTSLAAHASDIQNAKNSYAAKKEAYDEALREFEEKNEEYSDALVAYEAVLALSNEAEMIFEPAESVFTSAVNTFLQSVRTTLPELSDDVTSLLDKAGRYETEYKKTPQNTLALASALNAKKAAIDTLKEGIADELTEYETDKDSKFNANTASTNDLNKKQREMDAAENGYYDEVGEAQEEVAGIQSDVPQEQAQRVRDALANGGEMDLGDVALDVANSSSVFFDNNWGIIGKAINVVRKTVWFADPWQVIGKFKEQELSELPPDDIDSIQPFLNNVYNMIALLDLIEYQRAGILEQIEGLSAHLDTCSAALRGDKDKGMTKSLNDYKVIALVGIDHVVIQLGNILHNVVAESNESYFSRLGQYLGNPRINVGGKQMTFSQIIGALDVGLTSTNSADFNTLLSAGSVKAVPYFDTLNEPGASPKYIQFTDDDNALIFYRQLYQKFGDDSFFMHEMKELGKFFQNLIEGFFSEIWDILKALSKGAKLDAEGADKIPDDIWAELRRREIIADFDVSLLTDIANELVKFGTGQESNQSSIWKIVRRCADQLETALKTFTFLGVFTEPDGLINQLAMVTYDTNMFSCYATQNGTTFQDYKFNRNLNYQLGWEQEYLLMGMPSESLCLGAVSGMIFAARLVLNVVGTFLVPAVNEFCMADPEPITQSIARFIFALGETYIDIYQLRSGKNVPIVKFVNDHWTFGNILKMKESIEKKAAKVITDTTQGVVEALNKAFNAELPQLKQMISDIDVKDVYSRGITLAAMIRLEQKHGVGAITGSFWEGVNKSFDGLSLDYFNMRAETTNTEIINWNGYKKERIGQEDVWTYKGVELDSILDKTTQSERLEKLTTGQESRILSAEGSSFIKGIADDIKSKIWAAITPAMSYQDYLSVFLFFVPPLTLVSRTQDLIAVNMSNVMQNSGRTTPLVVGEALTVIPFLSMPTLKYEDLPLSKEGLFDLSKAYTAFDLTTTAEMKMLFMSSAFFGRNAEPENGLTLPKKIKFAITSHRGY